MLEKIFTKNNIIVNSILTGIAYIVWLVALNYTAAMAFGSALVFFGIMFVFDWLIVLFKDRTTCCIEDPTDDVDPEDGDLR